MSTPPEPTGLSRLLRGRADGTLVQLVRYTFVGGLAFLVDFGLLALLTSGLGVHYLVSAALAFLGGLTTNYLISTAWVFSRRNVQKRWLEALIFAAIGVLGLGLNELVMWTFTGLLGLHYMLSKVVSTGIVYFWNFFARKLTLFR